jgi:hypothetical protein
MNVLKSSYRARPWVNDSLREGKKPLELYKRSKPGDGYAIHFYAMDSKPLPPDETPPPELLNFLARQLGLSAGAWGQLCRTR